MAKTSSDGRVKRNRFKEALRSEANVQRYNPGRSAVEIRADLSQDKKRELLFKARSLLVVGLWTIPPRKMIRELVKEIDKEIDREGLVGCTHEENPLE